MNFDDILCVSDSTHAFTIIKQPRQDSHRYAFIVEGIKDFLKENLRVQLVHTLREGNMCVNFLAKLDPNFGDSLTEISTPPLELVELLTVDAKALQSLDCCFFVVFLFLSYITKQKNQPTILFKN